MLADMHADHQDVVRADAVSFALTHACMRACVQTIKTWYKLMPDALGKKLAVKRGLGVNMPEEERQKREQQTEEEYLRKEGFSEEQVQKHSPYLLSLYQHE
jgi:hypothetical protein